MAGRRPVEEAFVARRPAIRLLVVPQRRAALEKIVLHATNLRIPIVEVEGGSLTALAGFDGHQGVALVVEPRRYAGIDDVLARAAERGESPFVLVLDSLEDPHNVGSLLRSAEAAGVHGVLYPTHRQAPLSPSAVKASAGAVEHLLLCPVDDLPAALSDLHARGLRIAGADGGAPLTARQSDLRGPLAVVVGSEGQGLGPAVRRRCDLFMRIPMRGAVGSLNAAVAGSILLFEAVAQREPADIDRALSAPAVDATPADTTRADAEPAVVAEDDRPADVVVSAGTAEPAVATTPTRTAKPPRRARPATSTSAAESAERTPPAISIAPTKPTRRASSATPVASPEVVLDAAPAGTSSTSDKPGRADKSHEPDKPGKAEKPHKADKPGKADRSSKADKPGKADKSSKSKKPPKAAEHGKRAGSAMALEGQPSDAGAVENEAIAPVGSGDDELLPEDGAAPAAPPPKRRPSRARQGT